MIEKRNKMAAQARNRKRWQKAVSIAACLVVFVTSYALIHPAITMSRETAWCGLEEHVENVAGEIRVTADALQIRPVIVAPFVAIPILLVLLLLLFVDKRKPDDVN